MVSPRAAATPTRGRPRKNWSAPPRWPPPAASSPLPPSTVHTKPRATMCNYDMSLEMFHKTCPNQKAFVISCAIAMCLGGKRETISEWGTAKIITNVMSRNCQICTYL